MNAEREYQQLHADSTVHSLTLVPALVDGVVCFEDSPLVRALIHGRVLVLDEADKAPVEVLLVLKQLLSDGEIALPDGRLFVSAARQASAGPTALRIDAQFRLVALANRPGYPFLGNELMYELGDSFAVHVVENPDYASEYQLLSAYAPDVPASLVRSVCLAFADLRRLVDDGSLAYPYSTREAVSIVKHMQRYPTDGFPAALRNVFDFDAYDSELVKLLFGVFHRHGLPTAPGDGDQRQRAEQARAELAARVRPLPPCKIVGTLWQDTLGGFYHRNAVESRVHIDAVQPAQLFAPPDAERPLHDQLTACHAWQPLDGLISQRVAAFTEQLASWSVRAAGRVVGPPLAALQQLFVLTVAPLTLHCFCTVDAALHHRTLPLATRIVRHTVGGERHASAAPPVMCPFDDSAIVVFEPCRSVALLVDVATHRSQAYLLPVDPARPPSLALRTEFAGPVQLLHVEPGVVAVHAVGTNRVVLFGRVDGGACVQRTLDFQDKFGLRRLDVFHPWRWLVTAASGILFDLQPPDLRQPDAALAVLQPVFADYADGVVAGLSRTHNAGFDHACFKRLAPDSATAATDVLQTLHRKHAVRSSSASDRKHAVSRFHLFGSAAPDLLAGVYVGFAPRPPPDSHLRTKTHCATAAVWLRPAAEQPRPKPQRVTAAHGSVSDRLFIARSYPREIVIDVLDLLAGDDRTGSWSEVQLTAIESATLAPVVGLAELPDGRVVSLQDDGTLRLWEFRLAELSSQLNAWQALFGQQHSSSSSLDSQTNGGEGSGGGGGEGSGGEGGRGSGGSGGEGSGGSGGSGQGGGSGGGGVVLGDVDFNIVDGDAGLKQAGAATVVLAASDPARDQALLEKAREQAEHAVAKQLGSSSGEGSIDNDQYARLRAAVAGEVTQLRNILEQVEAKEHERAWVKLQISGELDDGRLVDLAVGERSVYKRRADVEPLFRLQKLPKRLRFVMDVSSSMSRFNGVDRRLDRMAATLIMIFEAFDGFDHKYAYSVVGHDGESPLIPFVDYHQPPRTREERKKVIEKSSGMLLSVPVVIILWRQQDMQSKK